MLRSESESKVPQMEVKWYDDWIRDNIPQDSLKDKVAIVTGANSGTGYWCAHALAGRGGATVVLACRSMDRATHAKDDILSKYPGAKLDIIELDNSDLGSVKEFADTFLRKYQTCDYLVNNAGIGLIPYELTQDGQEIQFQTNHLGHFLLTKLLFTTMVSSPGQARIVNHSSGAHYIGNPYFDPECMEHPQIGGITGWMLKLSWWPILQYCVADYSAHMRYGVSKLCNILFTKGLQKRINDAELSDKIIAVACHPGYASTGLQSRAQDAGNWNVKWNERFHAQSAADGSLPLLMACVGGSGGGSPDNDDNEVQNGDYIGPQNWTNGPPVRDNHGIGGYGNDIQQSQDLWTYSEQAIGPRFKFEISNDDQPRTDDKALDKIADRK